jgi:hypothetical protein
VPELQANGLNIPLLLQQLGFATGGQIGSQRGGASNIEQLIMQLTGGPRSTNALSPVANEGAIGQNNQGINSLLQSSFPNVFNLVGADASNSLLWAQQAAAKRAAAEAEAKQAALQKRLLEAQRKAAVSGIGTGTSGTGAVGGSSARYGLDAMPLIDPNKAKTPKLKLPTVNSKVKVASRVPAPIIAADLGKNKSAISSALENSINAALSAASKLTTPKPKSNKKISKPTPVPPPKKKKK